MSRAMMAIMAWILRGSTRNPSHGATMHKLVVFWKKDLVSKLIILVVILLVVAGLVDLYVITSTQSGKALLSDLFPTPTLAPQVIFTHAAETAIAQSMMATASIVPTITTRPFTPYPTPTPVSTSTPKLLPTAIVITLTPTAETTQADLTPPTPAATITQISPAAQHLACIPDKTPQYAKVVEVVDGNTVKVLLDGLVYQVRYLGVDLPTDDGYATLASSTNGKLVFLKEVALFSDAVDKDLYGRLLRYVVVDGAFVNLDLIHQGLVSVASPTSIPACAQVFLDAQQAAISSRSGIWAFQPTPTAP